jgi:hypothetical protein
MLLHAGMPRRAAPLLMTLAACCLKVIEWGVKKALFLIVWMTGLDEDAVSPCTPCCCDDARANCKGDLWVSLMFSRLAN